MTAVWYSLQFISVQLRRPDVRMAIVSMAIACYISGSNGHDSFRFRDDPEVVARVTAAMSNVQSADFSRVESSQPSIAWGQVPPSEDDIQKITLSRVQQAFRRNFRWGYQVEKRDGTFTARFANPPINRWQFKFDQRDEGYQEWTLREIHYHLWTPSHIDRFDRWVIADETIDRQPVYHLKFHSLQGGGMGSDRSSDLWVNRNTYRIVQTRTTSEMVMKNQCPFSPFLSSLLERFNPQLITTETRDYLYDSPIDSGAFNLPEENTGKNRLTP